MAGPLSSSSKVTITIPRGPTARSIAGRLSESQASPLETGQLCMLLQLLGTTNASAGSLPAAMSAARSEYGRSFWWFRLPKSAHGSCLRVYMPPFTLQSLAPAAGRSSAYARQATPAASHACPRFSAMNGEPGGGHLSSVTPCVLPDHIAM